MDDSEKSVQNRIFSWLVTNGAVAIRVNSGAVTYQKPGARTRFVRFVMWRALGTVLSSAGVSDILACCDGKFVAIECKAPGKARNITPAQDKFLTTIRKAGGLAIVADDLETVRSHFEFIEVE